MEPVRWGIAGFGWVARDFMAPAIQQAGDRLAAVADPDAAAREEARVLGATGHPTIAALVADPEVEAIYVATPNHLHREGVEAAARAGKAILCEKPMAATLVDAQAIAVACREAGVLYGTAFDQRHHSAHRALRAAIRDGMVGTVTAVRIVYACWLGPDWTQGRAAGFGTISVPARADWSGMRRVESIAAPHRRATGSSWSQTMPTSLP